MKEFLNCVIFQQAKESACFDMNECLLPELNSCHENADCFNKNGTYECQCKEAYHGDGRQCQNFCSKFLNKDCGPNAECRRKNVTESLSGLYDCFCEQGYMMFEDKCYATCASGLRTLLVH